MPHRAVGAVESDIRESPDEIVGRLAYLGHVTFGFDYGRRRASAEARSGANRVAAVPRFIGRRNPARGRSR